MTEPVSVQSGVSPSVNSLQVEVLAGGASGSPLVGETIGGLSESILSVKCGGEEKVTVDKDCVDCSTVISTTNLEVAVRAVVSSMDHSLLKTKRKPKKPQLGKKFKIKEQKEDAPVKFYGPDGQSYNYDQSIRIQSCGEARLFWPLSHFTAQKAKGFPKEAPKPFYGPSKFEGEYTKTCITPSAPRSFRLPERVYTPGINSQTERYPTGYEAGMPQTIPVGGLWGLWSDRILQYQKRTSLGSGEGGKSTFNILKRKKRVPRPKLGANTISKSHGLQYGHLGKSVPSCVLSKRKTKSSNITTNTNNCNLTTKTTTSCSLIPSSSWSTCSTTTIDMVNSNSYVTGWNLPTGWGLRGGSPTNLSRGKKLAELAKKKSISQVPTMQPLTLTRDLQASATNSIDSTTDQVESTRDSIDSTIDLLADGPNLSPLETSILAPTIACTKDKELSDNDDMWTDMSSEKEEEMLERLGYGRDEDDMMDPDYNPEKEKSSFIVPNILKRSSKQIFSEERTPEKKKASLNYHQSRLDLTPHHQRLFEGSRTPPPCKDNKASRNADSLEDVSKVVHSYARSKGKMLSQLKDKLIMEDFNEIYQKYGPDGMKRISSKATTMRRIWNRNFCENDPKTGYSTIHNGNGCNHCYIMEVCLPEFKETYTEALEQEIHVLQQKIVTEVNPYQLSGIEVFENQMEDETIDTTEANDKSESMEVDVLIRCPICDKEFTRYGSIKRQMINIHKVEDNENELGSILKGI